MLSVFVVCFLSVYIRNQSSRLAKETLRNRNEKSLIHDISQQIRQIFYAADYSGYIISKYDAKIFETKRFPKTKFLAWNKLRGLCFEFAYRSWLPGAYFWLSYGYRAATTTRGHGPGLCGSSRVFKFCARAAGISCCPRGACCGCCCLRRCGVMNRCGWGEFGTLAAPTVASSST